MFVQNETRHKPALARTRVSSTFAAAAVVVRSVWRTSAAGLVPWEGPRPDLDSDAPSTARQALWDGTSVTMAGTVRGPLRPPHVVRVDLEAGAEKRSVRVHGDRQWVRNAGRLVASPPAPFEQKPLSWSLAFGGAYDLAPGFDRVRKLPHPGGRITYPLNPGGVGFYQDEKAAEGQPLPSVEWRDEPITTWDQQPAPAGVSPCPDLSGLRMPLQAPSGAGDVEWEVRAALRLAHHAPRELIFDNLVPGTVVRGSGLGAAAMMLEVPPSPVRVMTRRGKSSEEVAFRVRSVHLSAEDGAVIVEHAHAFGYEPDRPPSWVHVEERR
jgi:hypothetical protein